MAFRDFFENILVIANKSFYRVLTLVSVTRENTRLRCLQFNCRLNHLRYQKSTKTRK